MTQNYVDNTGRNPVECRYNIISFEFVEAEASEESWAENCGLESYPVVRILVDGQDILDLFIPIEAGQGGKPLERAYGHLSPEDLGEMFSFPETPVRASICCCGGCGVPGCWGVSVQIDICESEVVWHNFMHTHRAYEYGSLTFVFERRQYEEQMAFLRAMVQMQQDIQALANADIEDELDDSDTERRYNVLSLELFDACTTEKLRTTEYDTGVKPVVRICIDGEDVRDLLVAIEEEQLDASFLENPYGYQSPRELHGMLEFPSSPVHGFLCCREYGEEGCLGVRARIEINESEVIWYDFSHTHRPYRYGLSLFFKRQQYEVQMSFLRAMARLGKICPGREED